MVVEPVMLDGDAVVIMNPGALDEAMGKTASV